MPARLDPLPRLKTLARDDKVACPSDRHRSRQSVSGASPPLRGSRGPDRLGAVIGPTATAETPYPRGQAPPADPTATGVEEILLGRAKEVAKRRDRAAGGTRERQRTCHSALLPRGEACGAEAWDRCRPSPWSQGREKAVWTDPLVRNPARGPRLAAGLTKGVESPRVVNRSR
jgi:hypothetical protein